VPWPEFGRPRGDEPTAVAALGERDYNFDPSRRDEYTPENGWHIDDYGQKLPAEAPGPPEPDGPWEIARRLMRHYEFANPRRVRAFWPAGAPLAGRNMLLVVRFWGMRFRSGVRISDVVDEEREFEGRRARVWGWGYRTLQGHLESGQMDYSVWKWLDTGEVEFHIHAVSRRARVRNPITQLGFRIFGRREQVDFARYAAQRMGELTRAVLERGPEAEPVPEERDGLAISPSPLRDAHRDRVAQEHGEPAAAGGPRGGSRGSMS
jgi:uncharacterized protein (UPF0548 family)